VEDFDGDFSLDVMIMEIGVQLGPTSGAESARKMDPP
jgi:hypothetical protein